MCVSADGKLLYLADATGRVYGIRLEDNQLQHEFDAGAPVKAMAVSPNGNALATVHRNVRLWDLKSQQELLASQATARDFVADVAFSPNGSHLAVAYATGGSLSPISLIQVMGVAAADE